MNLKDKLRQLDRSAGGRDAASLPRRAPAEDALDRQLKGEWVETDAGRFLRVRNRYPLPHPHGAMLLRPAHEIHRDSMRVMAKNSISDQFDPQQALFFDTETTGLAGGTGTYVFLIGLGYCTDDAFVVEQLFLPELNGERAMLAYFDSLLQQRRGLVSFNGKSFDAPLLRTRFIQQRMPPTLDLHEHLDLLHAARRLVKSDYGDCSLSTLERSLLGLERHGDVPGEEIPPIYMDFLRTGNTNGLPPIFYHNRMDILSLYALLMHLTERVRLARVAGIAPQQAARVAQLHVQVRAPETAATIYRNLLEKQEIDPASEVEFLLHFARSKKTIAPV
ncbi:MAG: ribonuclease H-like domain-containing protein [candidate division KSB1 bacterium]|nr:ribonuclease H-like domain-containing protein [candidate division KSB1 bacterium]